MSNDAVIVGGILIVFLLTGFALPFINEDFGGGVTANYSTAGMVTAAGQAQGAGSLSIWSVLKSMLSVFFWTFGGLPVFIDLVIFIPLRLVLAFVIARNIWIGGGA